MTQEILDNGTQITEKIARKERLLKLLESEPIAVGIMLKSGYSIDIKVEKGEVSASTAIDPPTLSELAYDLVSAFRKRLRSEIEDLKAQFAAL